MSTYWIDPVESDVASFILQAHETMTLTTLAHAMACGDFVPGGEPVLEFNAYDITELGRAPLPNEREGLPMFEIRRPVQVTQAQP